MQVCTSLQTDNHASTLPLKFFTGRMPFLPLNRQRQSTEGMRKFAFKPQLYTKIKQSAGLKYIKVNTYCGITFSQ